MTGYHSGMGNRSYFGVRFASVLASLFLLGIPFLVLAADLGLSPKTGTFPSGKEFSVDVTIDPAGEKVNASDGKLTFDASILSVSSITKDGSVFSLWTADPKFSNSDGTIEYSGGTPSAFQKSGRILTIKFKGKKEGTSSVLFGSSTVLAADGKGTDVYKTGGTASFVIGPSAPAEAPPAEAPAETAADSGGGGDGVLPIAPVITSSTHPKSDAWYATTSADFAWKPTADVTAIRTLFSDKDDELAASLQTLKLAVSQKVVAKKDGVWYFYVQYKNDFGWGELAKKQVQIDTVPPKEFEITLKADGPDKEAPKIAFSAVDDLSGVDRYELIFASTSVATIKVADLANGATLVTPQPGGKTLVTVKAFDKAGNVRSVQKDMVLPLVAKPVPKSDVPLAPPAPLFTIERALLVIFSIIMGAIAMSNYKARKRQVEVKAKILDAVLKVRDKNDKVFSAMRDEFEQMVNDFDERPQLSAAERDFLETIKEVLDISEEVIDTGVEELKMKVREQ